MYAPAAFRETDPHHLHALMRRFPFALLVTATPNASPVATPLPFSLSADGSVLRAHMARANLQWQDFAPDREALVVFSGPHAYVSPTWYETQPEVPTWNYAAVHAYGLPRLLDEAETDVLLRETVAQFEPHPETLHLPDNYLRKMRRGVVGFEITITRLEGKWKMSQNKSAENRRRVQAALSASDSPLDRETAAEMKLEDN